MEISEYLKEIQKTYDSGEATEHSYRIALAKYLTTFFGKNISVINEPKQQECGALDFAIYELEMPIGHIETKKIGENLNKLEDSEQLIRYKESLDNFIFTDYLEFIYYKAGKERSRIQIAELKNDKVLTLKNNFQKFTEILEDFRGFQGQFIATPQELASIMAKKTKLISASFYQNLESEKDSLINDHYDILQNHFIENITKKRFASIYAETLTYGLFIARLHDKNPKNFSKEKAYELIPKSNPFLQRLFIHIATDIAGNIQRAIDLLCKVFRDVGINQIVEDLGKPLKRKDKGKTDPMVYFYEDFLRQYNPEVRKARGIYYTPEPVVNFIVRAIDSVLKNHFNLPDGIADKSKVTISNKEMHKVQLLDVATGTGSFLTEVINKIHETFQKQTGSWHSYVAEHLLPRLHGFEILMSAYAMCHLKINLLLKEKGYISQDNQRLKIYLTNALEEGKKIEPFDMFFSNEINEAAQVKIATPIMVAFGNPPYSISSQNKGQWILQKIKKYKENLNEIKINLDDDYIKFIRMAEYYIAENETGTDENKEGIVAMITNNSFLDGITHRQMRKHLLETFDCIYIYNLHGDIERDGSKDKNVFDIRQGVAISIFIKDSKKQGQLADVYHLDSYGRREEKYQRLWEGDLETMPFQRLNYKEPYYFFVPKDFQIEAEYNRGFKMIELFKSRGSGIKTERDRITIHQKKEDLINTVNDFKNLSIDELRTKYNLFKDSRDWSVERAKQDIIKNYNFDKFLKKIQYRPFDKRYIYYTGQSKGFVGTPGYKLMKQFLNNKNIGFIATRQFGAKKHFICFITDNLIEISSQPFAPYCLFPLYIYEDSNTYELKNRNANLDKKIVSEIEKKLGLKFVVDHELPEAQESGNFSPLDLLDYIYAVLHSPNYRKKYKEFLKIDFPRVPYPEDKQKFKKLVKLGSQLRETHLLQGKNFGGRQNFITNYDIQGNNLVEKIYFDLDENSSELGRVYINKTQYFGKVPKVAWDFFIGGYQPAQKWLKDRKDRTLSSDDIEQYQKISYPRFKNYIRYYASNRSYSFFLI